MKNNNKQPRAPILIMTIACRCRLLQLSALALFLLITLFCWSKPGPAAESCATLLTGRCESCHYMTRVCEKIAEKKGKWSWKRTVKNMVKQGAKLSDTEQDSLVDCLSQPAPEVLKLCPESK